MAGAEHDALIAEITRRGFLQRAGVLGLGALVVVAVPLAGELVGVPPALAEPNLADATLQAFADTMIPGRKATTTDLGNDIHPLAIAGVDDEPGAVEADALALYHDSQIGFDALEAPFLADLESRSLPHGGPFLDLSFEKRVAVCVSALDFSNPGRVVYEAAAGVPFTAFCAAALIRNATDEEASGYRVMGLPGAARHGYRNFSYDRKLAKELTEDGNLP